MGLHSLSDEGGKLVSPALLRAAAPAPGLSVVRVVMLADGHGMTSHEPGPPKEIRPKAGDVLDVSGDLAKLWADREVCETFVEPEEPKQPPPVSAEKPPADPVPAAPTPKRGKRKTARKRR